VLILVLVLAATAVFIFYPKQKSAPATQSGSKWEETGVAISGKFADADIVEVEDDKFRMYYSAEPETPDFNGQVYSSVSKDGISWEKESGTRITSATFPSVIKLPDGKYRMYFQKDQVIKSALSEDGLSWKTEDGTRVDTSNPAGLVFARVLAPTVMKVGNEYLIVYAGAIDKPYSEEKVPNQETHLFMWAKSSDGLTFEKMGIALDSRNTTFKGWVDGPELVVWNDGTTKLFFWGYFGVFESVFEKESFSEPKFVFYGPNFDEKMLFPSDPPGDPTLAKINGTWNMYYGYHQKGIYRATLNK